MSRLFPKLLKIILPVMVLVGILTVFGDRGLINAYKLKNERNDIMAKVEKLKRENRYLRGELSALRSDRRYVENIARKDLGLVREGETVYRFKGE